MTPYQLHLERWTEGCGHEACTYSRRVHCRGSIPCDVCFLGQAPGESENVLGAPFVGPAGKLIDRIIEQSIGDKLRYCLCNLVCCLPRDKDGNEDTPSHDQIKLCKERLEEFLSICKPRLIVGVGQLAQSYLDRNRKSRLMIPDNASIIGIVHPSYILSRMTKSQQVVAVQKCISQVRRAVEVL